MEEKTRYTFTKKRTCALLTVIIMILNMFSPYGVLMHQVQAAEPLAGEPYYELSILKPSTDASYIDTIYSPDDDAATFWYYWDYMTGNAASIAESTTRAVVVQLKIKGCSTVNSGVINLWYDNSMLTPTYQKTTMVGRPPVATYSLADASDLSEFATINWESTVKATTALDTSASEIAIDGYGASKLADGTIIAEFVFKLGDGKTIDDITTDMFTVKPNASNDNGLKLVYFPYGDNRDEAVEGKPYLKFDGFAQGKPQVTGITLKTPPTKDTYYNTENLDFTGGVITVNYDSGDPKDINIADEIAAGTLTVNSTTASDTTKKVTFTYEGQTVDFEYYTLDSIAKKANLNKMDYEHNDNVVFTGGKLEATYKNLAGASKTVEIDIPTDLGNGNLTVNNSNTAKANVDNKVLTYSYHGKTTTMTLNVTDPIDSIAITKRPANMTFDDGDSIDLTGVEISPRTRSGKTLPAIALPDARVTASTNIASVNAIPLADRWQVSETSLTAGKQTITLTFEGKTADLEITVNDVVKSVTITKQPTAKNKYGINASQLDFTGLEATVTTNGGGSFKVGPNSLNIDTSAFVSNSVNEQNFQASYGSVNVTNNVKITLTNYITGIEVTFPDTEFNYGTTLAEAIANATYKEVYADNTRSSAKAITAGMVTGYNGTPAASLFNSSGEYGENLSIKLTSTSNPFDILPAVASQAITIKDVIDETNAISIKYKPTMTYNYGEAFRTNGGMITLHYKSGRTRDVSMGSTDVKVTETDGTTINMSPTGASTNGQFTKSLKVTYTEGTKTYSATLSTLTINEVLKSIKVNSPKTDFIHSDPFNIGSGTITATYESENTETLSENDVTFTETTGGGAVNTSPAVSDYTNNSLTKNVTASYTLRGVTKTDNYNITIKNPMESIKIGTSPKASYDLNESTANAGGTIIVVRKAGNEDTQAVPIQDGWISNLTTNTVGSRDATVTYTLDRNYKNYNLSIYSCK